jgi:hypothetical protein
MSLLGYVLAGGLSLGSGQNVDASPLEASQEQASSFSSVRRRYAVHSPFTEFRFEDELGDPSFSLWRDNPYYSLFSDPLGVQGYLSTPSARQQTREHLDFLFHTSYDFVIGTEHVRPGDSGKSGATKILMRRFVPWYSEAEAIAEDAGMSFGYGRHLSRKEDIEQHLRGEQIVRIEHSPGKILGHFFDHPLQSHPFFGKFDFRLGFEVETDLERVRPYFLLRLNLSF